MPVKVLIHASQLHGFVANELIVEKVLDETRGWLVVESDLCAIPNDVQEKTDLYFGDDTKDKLGLLKAQSYFENDLPCFTLEELGERLRDAYIEVHGQGEWETVGVRWASVFTLGFQKKTLNYFNFATTYDAVKFVIMESIGAASFIKIGQTFLTDDGRFATIRATDLNVGGEGYDILASVRDANGEDFIEWYKHTDVKEGVLHNDSGTSGLNIVLETAGVKNPFVE